jgi:SAM-dependent methyltransferase
VTSTDFVPALLESASLRARAEGHQIRFQEADAENLPFADASFDVVLSTFGVMFTPDQAKAATELARVCRPGGRIGLANWTPDSFVGQIFKTIGRYIPPAAGLKSPALWGTRERLEELFAGRSRSIVTTSRVFNFRFHSPAHHIEVLRTYYGPVIKAFAALDTEQQASLQAELLALVNQRNRSGDSTVVLPGEYLEVVIERG